jgi:hypothetical protein
MHVEHTGGDQFRIHINRETLTAIRWGLYHRHMASLSTRVEGKQKDGVNLLRLVDEIEREFHRVHEENKRRDLADRTMADILAHLNRMAAAEASRDRKARTRARQRRRDKRKATRK